MKTHLGVDAALCGQTNTVKFTVNVTEITCKACLTLPLRRVELGSIFDIDERCWPALRTMWEGFAEDRVEYAVLAEHHYEAEQLNHGLAVDGLTERFGEPVPAKPGWHPAKWNVDDDVEVSTSHNGQIIVRIDADGGYHPDCHQVLTSRVDDPTFDEELARVTAELWIKAARRRPHLARLVV